MNLKGLEAVALSIRSLSMDAIQKAKSGHPGLPLGCAELAAVLYGEIMKHNPADSHWADRDRFLLSAGHGSMLLYSILHLSGYGVTTDDIRAFRQVGSKCPGHPEYGWTDGVENTSGPLGQGVALAVGEAIAETMLASRFNTAEHTIVDHYTYSLVGEGCLMEGVSSEASSLAGHLKLGKLIVFYDENKISIDGSTDEAFTEDVAMRYKAYGWQVLSGSMYDMEGIAALVAQAKADTERPSLIMLKSVIGKGSPVEGTAAAHGAPLGDENVAKAKKKLGLDPEKFFYVDSAAYEYFDRKKAAFTQAEADWNAVFAAWSAANPQLRAQWDAMRSRSVSGEGAVPRYAAGDSLATRKASGAMLASLAARCPALVGGSADLEGPNATALPGYGIYSAQNRGGRTIRFGIREFAMACVTSGITLHGGLRGFCATFAVFTDYMRPAMRLAALMKLPVLYVLTHDSIYVGEDGPTHQPIETISCVRAIPGMQVIRAGDAEETVEAWNMAMSVTDHPVCLFFTRQNITVYEKDDPDWRNTMRCGAYVVRRGADVPDVTVLATGSEVELALNAAKLVNGKTVRVVSVPDRELFASQPAALRKLITGAAPRVIVAEAGSKLGWEGFVSAEKDIFCLKDFGASGPAKKVAEHFGFTAEKLAELISQ
ncbi:transketolase [Treponema brennaborense]|uniref:Transketolase n=1 Tax=Treponema brennaborense (strain DSM 12168 / CIP 105900 / DD5/3) TaxID=906968 RepID=F4LLM3_TREBD|nr:transketolase [Treponema brennaborense]AEE17667.1 transketolase [Treponema brennaborense DSM 12168]